MAKRMKPLTVSFLFLLILTVVVWVLRGLQVLAFLPGIVLWLLLLFSIGAGVLSVVQRTIRYMR
jgi:uncharacterized membrane protein YphA (DoxX/SURF4 family)